MKFRTDPHDFKGALAKLVPLCASISPHKQIYKNLKLDLQKVKSNETEAVLITLSALNNASGASITFRGTEYDGPDHTTIYIPPFKAPSGHNGNILVCEASSDGKYFTADFMGQKVTVPIYQHNEDEQFLKWDAILPEKTRQPTMKIVLDQKKLLPIIKAFESSNTDPIYLTFYGILGPVIITQITDFKQTAAIICPVRPAKEKEDQNDALLSDLRQH